MVQNFIYWLSLIELWNFLQFHIYTVGVNIESSNMGQIAKLVMKYTQLLHREHDLYMNIYCNGCNSFSTEKLIAVKH